MNSLDFLKQAQLADRMGNFRLADKLFNKASRVVFASAFDKALLEALEKAGIKAGERASLEAIETALADAIMIAIRTGESAEFRILAKEVGLNDEAISKLISDARAERRFDPNIVKRMARILESKLNSEESIFNRMIRDAPETPIKENPFKKGLTKGKEYWDKLMSKPNAKKLLAFVGITAVAGYAGWQFVKANGEEASDEEVENALSGSEMYDLRMQAGQQQGQNEKAQAYVDANKGKFTSQRDFYNAALGAGDKNFANDVIALVKKDLDLPIEPTKSEEKETSSNLNKTPYSGS